MKANNLDFKVFAVSGGDPTQNWAQGRMQGFIDGIKEADPGRDVRQRREHGARDHVRPGRHL